MEVTRRKFLEGGALTWGAAVAATGLAGVAFCEEKKNPNKPGVETTPIEDLGQEHGALRRIFLIYDEALRRLRSKADFDPTLIQKAAGLIRRFIEDYHERNEEDYLFPRLKKDGKLAELVGTLLAQHRTGRKITDEVLALATSSRLKNPGDAARLEEALASFNRMYRAHAAREDTVAFVEFRKLVTPREYDELGDKLEDREHQLFGKEGFEGVLGQIMEIEKALGIHDLARLTPKA